MTREYHPLAPEEVTARLNGLSAHMIRQFAASAVGLAQSRDTTDARGWRARIIATFKEVTRRPEQAARRDRRAA